MQKKSVIFVPYTYYQDMSLYRVIKNLFSSILINLNYLTMHLASFLCLSFEFNATNIEYRLVSNNQKMDRA